MPVDSIADANEVVNAFAVDETPAPQPKEEKKADNNKKKSKAETKKPDTKKAVAPKPKNVTHTVRRGDNLSKIAKKYGVTVANNMAGDNIQSGQKLKIPQK